MTFNSPPFSVDITESYVEISYMLWCTIKMHYNLQSPDLRVAIVGNIPALGMWDVKQAIIAHDDGNGIKSVTLNIEQGSTLLFKWVITDKDGYICRWEEGDNKVLHIPRIMAGSCDILAPWNNDANILSVHDRYGKKCCLEEAIRFADMDLDTFMNRKKTWKEIIIKSIISNDLSNKSSDTILDDDEEEDSASSEEEHFSRVSHFDMEKFMESKHERLKARHKKMFAIIDCTLVEEFDYDKQVRIKRYGKKNNSKGKSALEIRYDRKQAESKMFDQANCSNIAEKDTSHAQTKIIDQGNWLSYAKKELEKIMQVKRGQSKRMGRNIFLKDYSTKRCFQTRPWQQRTLHQRSWRLKVAAGIGIMSCIVIGSSAIYLASLQTSEPEPEPDTDLMQTTYEYLYDMANKAYDMINNVFVDPPAVPEPTTMEQLTAAVQSTYTTVVHGISSLMRSFF